MNCIGSQQIAHLSNMQLYQVRTPSKNVVAHAFHRTMNCIRSQQKAHLSNMHCDFWISVHPCRTFFPVSKVTPLRSNFPCS
ncbi:unnamed protein product [Larinioides sclopetarius]|uniref:Uncharacterized protein n=1 Tax=Larinioides sclopetarius TaxID=280406 RepID=A0AAV1ZKH7_9ARAC